MCRKGTPAVAIAVPLPVLSLAADRCDIVGGYFFEGAPGRSDAYLLSCVIHDWNDAAAVEILRNCRRAIRPEGTLILLDTVLTGSSDRAPTLMDLLMMVLTGGRERTESDLRPLHREAGVFFTRMISTAGPSRSPRRTTVALFPFELTGQQPDRRDERAQATMTRLPPMRR